MGPAFTRKYNTLLVTGTTAIRIPMIKRAVVDFAVGADWTPAGGDVKINIDGAGPTNVTNLPSAVASGNGAYWEFILTAAELSCKQAIVTIVDSATKAVEDNCFLVETFGNASAMYVTDLSAALATAAAVAAVQADTDDIQTRIPSALTSNGNMKSSLVEILTTALTETAGQIAGGFKKFFNIATPAATMDHGVLVDTVTTATTATNLTNAPTAGDLTATMKTSIGTAVAASAVASVTGGVTVTTNNDKTGYTLSNTGMDNILDRASGVETSVTLRQALRLMLAALAGKVSGAATTTVVIRDVNDTKNRISATVDSNGNRTAVTTDVS